MDATAFWQVIGTYNSETYIVQLVLLTVLAGSVPLSVLTGRGWICKIVLSMVNFFIAMVFFFSYGTEPIQKYFALPLFLGIGALLLYEAWKNADDIMRKPSVGQSVLLVLYLVYPLVSVLCGHEWPQLVTHIMPCPVATVSIALYAGYRKKNNIILVLLSVWGLTGVKAIFFNAYEDLILLIAGIYCISLLFRSRFVIVR